MDNRNNWDKTYISKGYQVPWFLGNIPSFFQEIASSLKPCKTLDLGCGLGQYAGYLAKRNFKVTAIDFSQKAIDTAKEKVPNVNFKCMNVLDINKLLKTKFDFIYDISLFHHLDPKTKEAYTQRVKNQLSPKGVYVVCAFNTEDKYFQGKKEFFSSVSDTTLYPVTLKIIVDTFDKHFNITKIEQITWGKEYDKKRWLVVMKHKNKA